MNSLNTFRIEQPSLVQALDKYREMEKVLVEEREKLQDIIDRGTLEWQGSASEATVQEVSFLLTEGNYNMAYENVRTMRTCMENTLEQVNALLVRSEEFPKQLQSSAYIEPMRPAKDDNTIRNGGVLYLDYGKAMIIPELCEEVSEAATYLGNVLIQQMEACRGIIDDVPGYINRVEEAVHKIKRIENYKQSFQGYVQGVRALENDVYVQLSCVQQSNTENSYNEDSFVLRGGDAIHNMEYEFLDFLNGTTTYYDEQTLLASLEQMYNDGYFTSEDYQKLRDLISLYTHLPGQDAAIIRGKILDIYSKSEKEYELLQKYVSEEVLEQLGWTDINAAKQNFGENFIEELRIAMMKVGIVSETSIKMFLTTITHECGRGLFTIEDVNSNGITGNYTYDTRGAGLIQLTGLTQKSFFDYLQQNNIGDQEAIAIYLATFQTEGEQIIELPEGLSPTEYIAKYYSIDAAVWFWAIMADRIEVNGQFMTINECIEQFSSIEPQEKLLLVTQLATTGTEYATWALGNMCLNPEGLEYDTCVEFNNVSLPLPNGWDDRSDIWRKWEEIK